jgi:hypothetical protein
MAKIIQICPVSRNEETKEALVYALDSEGNVFMILEGEDMACIMSNIEYRHILELLRKDGEI